MAFAQAVYTINSGHVSTPSFSYASIPLLSANNLTDAGQLVVSLNGSTLTLTTDYTVDEGDQEVDVTASLTIGDTLVIERSTKVDARYVDFVNNSSLDEADLDLDSNQLFFLIQELSDDQSGTLGLDNSQTCWDADNKRICNLADGIDPTDAVSFRQLQSAVEGAETAVFDNVGYFSFSGDGSTAAFTCTGAGIGYDEPKEFWVWVSGAIQDPTTAYTVSGTESANPVITFTTAPAVGAEIRVRTIYGSIKAIISGDTIDGSSIAADTIGLSQLNVGSGTAGRFLVFDASGDPAARTITSTDITNFTTAVLSSRLDQFAAPVSDISMAGYRITNLAAGTDADDAVRKSQMDAAITSALGSFTGLSGNYGSTTSGGFQQTVTASLSFAPRVLLLRVKQGSNASETVTGFLSDEPIEATSGSLTIRATSTGSGLSFYQNAGVGITGSIEYLAMA